MIPWFGIIATWQSEIQDLNGKHKRKKISSSITNTPEIPRNPTLQVFQPLEIKVFGDFGRVPAGLEFRAETLEERPLTGHGNGRSFRHFSGTVAAIGSRFLGDKKCQENEQSWRNSTFF